jgi:hypothetical protein
LRRAGRLQEAIREYREVLRVDPARQAVAADITATEQELSRRN